MRATDLLGDVVDNEYADGTAEVTARDGLEPLLAGSVPDLHLDHLLVYFFVLHAELYAHCVLRARVDYERGKEIENWVLGDCDLHLPRRYWLRMQDLPTPVSPIMMNLNR